MTGTYHAGALQVLLATHNGERFLPEQLASIAAQGGPINILVSDDNSTDRTQQILRDAAEKWRQGHFEVVCGPCTGFARNFGYLIRQASDYSDYFAFSDQDDVWLPGKLDSARRAISAVGTDAPVLYCGRTRLIDAEGRSLGKSPLMARPPGFRNALVQSIAGGNTMVMNRAAFRLLQNASRDVGFVSHDWWAYLVISGAGGVIIYDPVPHVGYRQHDANLVGANHGMRARLLRLRLIIDGEWFDWMEQNITALSKIQHFLTADNQEAFRGFAAMRQEADLLRRIFALRRLGIYRQSVPGNISMMAALAFRKL